MTLFTSDRKEPYSPGRRRLPAELRTSLVYLAASIAVAIFGAVYEVFSHGVFSFFMIYAFMIPLLGGTVPFIIAYLMARSAGTSAKVTALRKGSGLYHAGIATLTIGSIMKGVLDIYGTTNRLIVCYPAVGALLIFAAAAVIIASRKSAHSSQDNAANIIITDPSQLLTFEDR